MDFSKTNSKFSKRNVQLKVFCGHDFTENLKESISFIKQSYRMKTSTDLTKAEFFQGRPNAQPKHRIIDFIFCPPEQIDFPLFLFRLNEIIAVRKLHNE